MLYYKMDIPKELKERGWTTYSLLKKGIMTQGTLKHIKEGHIVRPEVLDRLCAVLEVQPGDIIGFRKD